MATKMHLHLQNRSRSSVVLINPATPGKKAESIANIFQMEYRSRFHLAPGIVAKPVAGPEIEPRGICTLFLM